MPRIGRLQHSARPSPGITRQDVVERNVEIMRRMIVTHKHACVPIRPKSAPAPGHRRDIHLDIAKKFLSGRSAYDVMPFHREVGTIDLQQKSLRTIYSYSAVSALATAFTYCS